MPLALLAALAVSPAVVTADVDKPQALPPIQITNPAAEPWECRLALRPLGQALDGTPGPAAPHSYSAETLLTLDRSELRLEPGQTATVSLRAVLPGRRGGGYALLEVRGRPVGGGEWTVSGAEIRLHYPGPARASLSARRIDAAQERGGSPVVLSVRVKNEGEVALPVNGAVSVLDGQGRSVAQASLGPAAVLPGFERLIQGPVSPPRPGTYILTGTLVAAGAPPVVLSGTLEVVRPGEIATHRAAMVSGPEAKGPGRLEIVVENRGNLPLPALARGQVDGRPVTLAPPYPIPVGRRGKLSGVTPALSPGRHAVDLWVENPAGRPLFQLKGAILDVHD